MQACLAAAVGAILMGGGTGCTALVMTDFTIQCLEVLRELCLSQTFVTVMLKRSEVVEKDCWTRQLNKEDALDRIKLKKVIKDIV